MKLKPHEKLKPFHNYPEVVLKIPTPILLNIQTEAHKTRAETRRRIGSQNSHGFTPTVTQV